MKEVDNPLSRWEKREQTQTNNIQNKKGGHYYIVFILKRYWHNIINHLCLPFNILHCNTRLTCLSLNSDWDKELRPRQEVLSVPSLFSSHEVLNKCRLNNRGEGAPITQDCKQRLLSIVFIAQPIIDGWVTQDFFQM